MNGSGCKNCPVKPCETMNYRGSTCSAQRARLGLGDPMTNADRLDDMSIEEKAQFLHSIAYNRETPWSKPFYEKFCKDCLAPEYTLDDGRKLCLHECDFKDGKCPHGTDIVWWLQQPSK